jgi:hypothetical protein
VVLAAARTFAIHRLPVGEHASRIALVAARVVFEIHCPGRLDPAGTLDIEFKHVLPITAAHVTNATILAVPLHDRFAVEFCEVPNGHLFVSLACEQTMPDGHTGVKRTYPSFFTFLT